MKWEKLLQQCSFSLPFVFWASLENIYSPIYSGLHEREFGALLQSQTHSSSILPPRMSSGQIQNLMCGKDTLFLGYMDKVSTYSFPSSIKFLKQMEIMI